MGEVHRLLLEEGRGQALRSQLPRNVIEAASTYLGSEDTEIGFLYSGWCQAALPHKKLADDEVWQITTDHTSLLVSPGHKANAAGAAIAVGVPYGSRARLILLYL